MINKKNVEYKRNVFFFFFIRIISVSISDLVPSVNLELPQRTNPPIQDEQNLKYKGPKW